MKKELTSNMLTMARPFRPLARNILLCGVVAFSVAALLPPSASRAADLDPAAQEAVPATTIAGMILKLGDDSFQVREKTMENLWRMGEKALPALHEAQAGGDPEIADRARELALYIGAGVLFDSPIEVKELVLKFSQSDANEKIAIMNKLLQLRQWRQVLKLAGLEQDPAIQKAMSGVVEKVARNALRDAVAEDNEQLAEEVLAMTGDSQPLIQMRAWYRCRRGQLAQELEKAATMGGQKGALWRMSLHCASNNIPAAIKEAGQAGEDKLADALRVLGGDALPWLLGQNAPDHAADEIYAMGCSIQQMYLQGREREMAVLARRLQDLAVDVESSERVIAALAANGFRDEALDLLREYHVDDAFDYYDSVELPLLALEVLGIKPDAKPPYTDWVNAITAEALGDGRENLYLRIIRVAGFVAGRAEREHCLAVLSPMMTALMEEGADAWFDQIAEMTNYGLGAEAIHFIKQWGEEEREVELGVASLLSNVSRSSRDHIWECLRQRNQGNHAKALDELALLAGFALQPGDKADELHRALFAEGEQKLDIDKQTRMAALFEFCVQRNDLVTAARMADALAGDQKWVESKHFLDDALQRWELIEPVFAAKVKGQPGNYLELMNWYIALRKLGREKQAGEVYEKALLLSMGQANILNDWGVRLYDLGYEDEATELWLLAAANAGSVSQQYDRAIGFLSSYAQAFYRNGEWQRAAAISEAYCRLVMSGWSKSLPLQSLLRVRYYSGFCQGMHLLQTGSIKQGVARLEKAHRLVPGDGLLADDFFPMLRRHHPGLGDYERWFELSFEHIAAACKIFPRSHNSHNTAAWLASRAVRRIEAGHTHAEQALQMQPTQGAYLDTMAEVWFARGNRDKAMEWSRKAIAGSVSGARGNPRMERYVIANFKQLNKQYDHFKHDPLPAKAR